MTTINRAPVANAGANQDVFVGDLVTLAGGLSSDPDGNALTYAWSVTTRPTGSGATLSSLTVVGPTFTADKVGTYIASLIVNDGTVDSVASTVTIISEENGPLESSLGHQTMANGCQYIMTFDTNDFVIGVILDPAGPQHETLGPGAGTTLCAVVEASCAAETGLAYCPPVKRGGQPIQGAPGGTCYYPKNIKVTC